MTAFTLSFSSVDYEIFYGLPDAIRLNKRV